MSNIANSSGYCVDESSYTQKTSLFGNEKEIIGSKERDKLLEGIFGWGRNPESYFLYKGEGTELYEKILEDPKYLYYWKGMNLIKNNRSELLKYVKKNFTDWGSGTGLKSSLLLEHVDHSVNYVPVDYSHEMLEIARENLSKNFRINTREGIVLTGDSTNLVSGLEDNTYFYTGGTIGNFSKSKNIQDFKNMGNNSYFKGNYIIFDHFSAPTQKELDLELYPAYSNDSVRFWFENGLKMLGLSREDFEFHVEYIRDPEFSSGIIQDGQRVFPGSIQCGFRAKRDVEIPLNGKILSVKQGEFRQILSSKRYADIEINEILQKSGCKKQKVDLQQEKGMKLVVAKKLPSKFEQHKGKVRNALLLILGIGIGTGGYAIHNYNKKKNIINQATEIQYDGKKFAGNYAEMSLNQGDAAENMVNYFYSYFETMYDLSLVSSDHKQELKLLLGSKLFETDETGIVLASNIGAMQETGVYDFLLLFTKDYSPLLAKRGVPTTQSYSQLAKFAPNFQHTLDMQEEWIGFCLMGNGRILGQASSIPVERRDIQNQELISFNVTYDNMGNIIDNPNSFNIRKTLGTYKNSKLGIEYWTLVVEKSGKKYLLATPVTQNMPTAPKFTLECGKIVIKDYLTNFLGKNFSEFDGNTLLVQN